MVEFVSRRLFVSYAHEDRRWLDLLRIHLKPLADAGRLVWWDDRIIEAGDDWRSKIRSGLEDADVGVLLVTPHFLASDFIAREELPPLIAGTRVFWIAVSASSYETTALARYQCANDPGRPLDTLRPAARNRVLVAICKTLMAAVGEPSVSAEPRSADPAEGPSDQEPGIVRSGSWMVRFEDVERTGGPVVLTTKGAGRLIDGGFRCLAASPDGSMIAAVPSLNPSEIVIWKVGRLIDGTPRILESPIARLQSIAFAPGGALVMAGQGQVMSCDPDRPSEVMVLRESPGDLMLSECIVAGDGRIAAISMQQWHGAWVWRPWDRPDDSTPLREARVPLAFDRAGNRLATASRDGASVQIWGTDDPVVLLRDIRMEAEHDSVTAAAFAPDGRRIALGHLEGMVSIWDWQRPEDAPVVLRKPIEPAGPGGGSVGSVQFSPDGTRIAAGGSCDDGGVWVWDLRRRGAHPLAIMGRSRGANLVAFTPDGWLATADRGDSGEPIARLWELPAHRRS